MADVSSQRSQAGVDEALRALIALTPRVMAGLKRAAVPRELRPLFTTSELGPRHIPRSRTCCSRDRCRWESWPSGSESPPTAASLMVTQLHRHALVERHGDDSDRRRTIISIVADKQPTIERWLAARAEPMRRTLEQLPADERRVFIDAMALLADELERWEDPRT